MTRSRRLVRWSLILIALVSDACVDVQSSKDATITSGDSAFVRAVARDSQHTASIAERLQTVPEQLNERFADDFATTYIPPTPVDDSLLLRARALIAASRPGFREWPPNAYGTIMADSAAPQTTTGPLAGDFDGDGKLDVVLDGHEDSVMVTIAVLSNKGRPAVASVYEDPNAPAPPAPRGVRFAVVAYTRAGEHGFGVGVFEFDAAGKRFGMDPIFIYEDGRFVQLVVGE
jgi:hypothetical protein